MKSMSKGGRGLDETTRAQRMSALERQANAVLNAARLGAVAGEMEDVSAGLIAATGALQRLRGRGYRYAPELEDQAATLEQAWPGVRRRAEQMLREARQSLRPVETEARQALTRGRAARSEADFATQDDRLTALQKRVNQAQDEVRGAFDDFARQVRAFASEVQHLDWAVERLASASFALTPEENLVDACEAQWLTHEDEGPKGMLFLTDARLIFEQREKVTTKKVLFMPVAKKMVQELQFAAPIGGVEIVEAEDARGGFLGLGKQERLTLRFTTRTEGQDVSHAQMRLLQGADNQAWVGKIQQVQRDELRPVEGLSGSPGAAPDPGDAATPQEIPTRCPSCGALITTPIVKGMHEVKCEYCGAIIRF